MRIQHIVFDLLSDLTEVSFSVPTMRIPALIDCIYTYHDCYSYSI